MNDKWEEVVMARDCEWIVDAPDLAHTNGVIPQLEIGPYRESESEEQRLMDHLDVVEKAHAFKCTVNGMHIDSQKCWNFKGFRCRIWKSIAVVMFENKINLLFPFGPAAAILASWNMQHGWVFLFSLLGITPLAERLGFLTEQIAFYTGPTVGGLLNATFGNATEMIISIYALKNGMTRVVQQSLLGSILSNMLLVLGCSFLTGGVIHHKKNQVFNKAAAAVNSGLLLMAVMGLLFPAVLHFTHTELHSGQSELTLSRFSSCIMLVAYAFYLVFQLKSHKDLYECNHEVQINNGGDSEEEDCPKLTFYEAILWLTILTGFVSFLSGYLVNAIQGASESWNMPVAFISVILLPTVGNAAEHASAVMFAMKDKLDISLGVAIGSSTQISMFLFRRRIKDMEESLRGVLLKRCSIHAMHTTGLAKTMYHQLFSLHLVSIHAMHIRGLVETYVSSAGEIPVLYILGLCNRTQCLIFGCHNLVDCNDGWGI